MQIEVKIDSSCTEPKIIVIADKVDGALKELIDRLSSESASVLAGFQEDRVTLLEQENIVRIYASDGKVIADTGAETYTLRLRLYELEERLDKSRFIRISNSEIVNLRKVKGFDLSFTGTICVTLANGVRTFVSRRYVSKIKSVLGL